MTDGIFIHQVCVCELDLGGREREGKGLVYIFPLFGSSVRRGEGNREFS